MLNKKEDWFQKLEQEDSQDSMKSKLNMSTTL